MKLRIKQILSSICSRLSLKLSFQRLTLDNYQARRHLLCVEPIFVKALRSFGHNTSHIIRTGMATVMSLSAFEAT
jgi:hypothetical protein